MRITTHTVKDPDLARLYARLKEVAEVRGVSEEEAIREALYGWLDKVGSGEPARTIEVTEKEGRTVFAVLDAIREAKNEKSG